MRASATDVSIGTCAMNLFLIRFFHSMFDSNIFQAASVFTTAIVTGRSKDKVYNFVGLDDVFYAGSHGLEIQGPLERPVKCQVCTTKRLFVGTGGGVL